MQALLFTVLASERTLQRSRGEQISVLSEAFPNVSRSDFEVRFQCFRPD